MNTRLLAATVTAFAATLAPIGPADAATKTVKGSYSVELPVPFPVMEGMGDFYGCIDGQEGVSRSTRTITLPAPGLFKAQVSYTGDWDLYLLDTRSGTILAAAETSETGNVDPAVEKVSWKKAKKGQKVDLVVCNWSGLKDATVSWTHTYSK